MHLKDLPIPEKHTTPCHLIQEHLTSSAFNGLHVDSQLSILLISFKRNSHQNSIQDLIFCPIETPPAHSLCFDFSSSVLTSVMADEDFEEEEVWSFVKERKDGSPSGRRRAKDHHSFSSSSPSSSSSSSKRLPSTSRLIPRANANANAENSSRNHRQSAPVNIPDWSKIYRSNAGVGETANDDGEEFDDDGDEQLPPHEWIAKKLARSQISSFSVCEGAGRTLKGRDQRKVRNAVLTKTGFLE